MLVTRTSFFTGKVRSRELNVTQAEIDFWQKSGRTIQSVFPELSASDREFLLTGSTPEEWGEHFEPEVWGEHFEGDEAPNDFSNL